MNRDGICRWGILAPGGIATKFVNELSALPGSMVQAVASRSLEKAADFAKAHSIPFYFGSYEELVTHPEIDIIYVASPHSHHKEHTLLALQNGKAVLCEKAFALSGRDVELMIKTALQNNLFLAEAFSVPHQPSYTMAKELINSGRFGKIIHIQGWFGFNKSPYPETGRLINPALGGGALLDIGLYPLFDALYFAGTPDSIHASATLTRSGVDESVTVQLRFQSGVTASIFASFVSSVGVGTDVFCEKGVIRLRRTDIRNQKIEYQLAGEEVQIQSFDSSVCGLKLEARDAENCIREGKLQSTFMNHQMSLLLMNTMDRIRTLIGVRYPSEG